MRLRFKASLTALAVVVLAAALLVPTAGASGMMGTPSPSPSPTMMATPGPTPTPDSSAAPGAWCGGGIWNGTGSWGGTGMWGTGSGIAWLTSNPDALAAWAQLRAAHQEAQQTWYGAFKADLATPEAQQALHDLWTKNWNDMKAFYEQYGNGATWISPSEGMWGGWDAGGMMGRHGWDASHMWGSGHGAAWMTNHPRALGQWLTMRGKQTAAVSAWQHRYGTHPGSSAAQTALRTMRTHHRAQVRSFYTHHSLPVTTTRMRDGAGGWMGLGGMWGGFGW